MDDARAGRHDPQVAERGLRPAQELVALAVALVLAGDVEGEGAGRPEQVDLDRVVDDEVGGDKRVDARGIAAEVGHGVAHRREVDDRRHAGEVLEQDARGHERDLGLGGDAGPPGSERLDVGSRIRPPPALRSTFSSRILTVIGGPRGRSDRPGPRGASSRGRPGASEARAPKGSGIGGRVAMTRLLHRPRESAGSVGAGRVRPPRVEVASV